MACMRIGGGMLENLSDPVLGGSVAALRPPRKNGPPMGGRPDF